MCHVEYKRRVHFRERYQTSESLHLESCHSPTWRYPPGPRQVSQPARACSGIFAICYRPGSTWSARSTGWSKARRSGKHAGASVRLRSYSGPQIWRAAPSSFDQTLRPHWHRHLPSGARTAAGPCPCRATGPSRCVLCPPRRPASPTCCFGASSRSHRPRRSDDGARSETWQRWPWQKLPKAKQTSAKCSRLCLANELRSESYWSVDVHHALLCIKLIWQTFV